MIIATRHIVNLECAAVLILNLATLLAGTVFTNLLVPIPHIIAFHLTTLTFEKDTTANPIRFAPTVSIKMVLPSTRSVILPHHVTIGLNLLCAILKRRICFPAEVVNRVVAVLKPEQRATALLFVSTSM